MDSIWLVLGLALFPALGNFSGGLAAEVSRVTGRHLNYALHGAAGLVIAVVAVEIMPRALDNLSGWVIAVAFALGGIAYTGIEKFVESLYTRRGKQEDNSQTSVWMIYIAVSIDLFSDGLLIGAGSASYRQVYNDNARTRSRVVAFFVSVVWKARWYRH